MPYVPEMTIEEAYASKVPVRFVHTDGSEDWWFRGMRHRDDGPAIIWPDGGTVWCLHGHYHRDDGPAIEYAGGYKVWYKHGKQHCEYGPAAIWASGKKQWWLDDVQYNCVEWMIKVHELRSL